MRRLPLLVLFAPLVYLVWPSPHLGAVHFFDVGQGDAALVQTGTTQILIDGGPDDRVLASLGRAMPGWDRTIETVILSHPHADHYRGLKHVFERYRVGTFWVSGVWQESDEYQELEALARARGAIVESPGPGRRIAIANGSVRLLHGGFEGEKIANLNDASLAVSVQVGNVTVLFPGDAEEVEERSLAGRPGIRADILKVPHHGSRTSSTSAFLTAVGSSHAVISVGAGNRYGHPARQTLERLRDHGVQTYRTDQNGSVTLSVTAKGWNLKPER